MTDGQQSTTDNKNGMMMVHTQAAKLPEGSVNALGFFTPVEPTRSVSGPVEGTERLLVRASPLDPRAWSSLIAARYGEASDVVVEALSEPAEASGASAVLPEVELHAGRTLASNDWKRISRLLEWGDGKDPREGLYPSDLAAHIDELDAIIDQDLIETLFAIVAVGRNAESEHLNQRDFLHGAQTHAALRRVFYARLGWLDNILSRNTFLLGDRFTDADAHLFGVLLTFDIGYRNAFPVPDAAIVDYPYLWDYAKRIYHLPGLVTEADRRAIGLAPLDDGAYLSPWGEPAFTETVADIRAAWDDR